MSLEEVDRRLQSMVTTIIEIVEDRHRGPLDHIINKMKQLMAEHETQRSTPAAEPPVQSVSEPVSEPKVRRPYKRKAKTTVGDEDHARVDFETGRVTHKRKKRGHVWVRARKAPDGTVLRRGYWVSKRKLGWAKGKVGATLQKRPHGMPKRDWDMFQYYTKKFAKHGKVFTGTTLKEAHEFNTHVFKRVGETPEMLAERASARLAYYRSRAKKKGWPLPTTLEEGEAQNTKPGFVTTASEPPSASQDNEKKPDDEATHASKAAAVRVYQPHVRKAGKTYRKMRKRAAKMRTV